MTGMMALALLGGSRVVVTQTFTTNTSWVAPAGVTSILTLTGNGVAGTPGGPQPGSILVANVSYQTSGTGAGGPANTWSNMQGLVNNAISTLNSGGSGSVSTALLLKYANGTEDLFPSSTSYGGAIAGTASASYGGGWQSSGAITSSGTASANFLVNTSSTTGASTSAFGFTFPGGTGGPATPVTYTNVVVTPGTSYPINAAGGSITIAY